MNLARRLCAILTASAIQHPNTALPEMWLKSEDHLIGVADPQVLGLPLQLFLLGRLRERAHLWAELVTSAVLRGCEALFSH